MSANADLFDDAAKGISDYVVKPMADSLNARVQRSLAEANGPMARWPRAPERTSSSKNSPRKRANRGVRRSVKDCMKPGNVIDDDVQECVQGYREKTW